MTIVECTAAIKSTASSSFLTILIVDYYYTIIKDHMMAEFSL